MNQAREASVSFNRVTTFAEEVDRIYERIRGKAYEHYLADGGIEGHDLDHWLLAERELVTRPEFQLRREDRQFVVEVPVSGFDPDALVIQVTNHALLITSEPGTAATQVFSVVHFPASINPQSIDAAVAEGRLRILASTDQDPVPAESQVA